MADQADLDELLELGAMVARPCCRGGGEGGGGGGGGPRGPRARVLAEAAEAAEEEDPEVQDLVAMADLGQVVRRPRQALDEQGRKRQAEMRLEAKLANEKRARHLAVTRLRLAALQDPTLCGVKAALPPKVVAQVVIKLAAQPRLHSTMLRNKRRAQTNALAVVSQTLHDAALDYWKVVAFSGGRPPEVFFSARPAPAPGQRSSLVFAIQWDETSQRFRSLAKRATSTERVTAAPVAAQVMVCSGQIVQSGLATRDIHSDPYFCRSLALAETSANFLVAAVLRSLPLDLENADAVAQVCGSVGDFVLSFTTDRASANLAAVGWIAKLCEGLPHNVLPWSELCAAHGCALVKTRAPMLKSLSTSLCSFTLWVRHSRNIEVLRAEVKRFITGKLVVSRREPKPDHEAKSRAVVSTLYGGDSSDALWKFNTRAGEFVPTEMKEEFDRYCQVAPCGRPGGQWTHHCWVLPGSEEERRGMRVGAPCCTSRDESVEKVTGIIATVLMGRAWKRAVESRWTNVTSAMRRFLLANSIGDGILTNALREVKTHWQLNADLIPTLARMVAADANDFPARNKLRLLRLVQAFVHDDINWQAAISLTTSTVADELLFFVLGGARKDRASLRHLLHPFDSPIVACQRSLWDLFCDFAVDGETVAMAEKWVVLDVVGGQANCPRQRLEARRAILQLSIGVTDLFELRYSKPPYSLVVITYDDDVPAEPKRKAIADFFAEPDECLPMFCSRLKRMHPTPIQFCAAAASTLKTWSVGTFVSIDFSERAHSQFRHDVTSKTSGTDFLATSNRLLVRQYSAAQVARGGLEPSSRSAGPELEDLGPIKPKRRGGGNNYVTFSNAKRKAFKALVAPHRRLTQEEQEHMKALVAREWAQVSSDPAQLAVVSAMRDVDRPDRPASSLAVVPASGGVGFDSPCCVSDDKRNVVRPEVVAKALRELRDDRKEGVASRLYGVKIVVKVSSKGCLDFP